MIATFIPGAIRRRDFWTPVGRPIATNMVRRSRRSSWPRNSQEAAPSGQCEARYVAFLETITHLRPSLHRYCARMMGSIVDGEDVVQDALFQAYRKLETFDDTRPLSPWLFRIAHNQCIDFL